ncbi:unnamed protein product [Bemisia tabaci]|uniref:Ionotropic receptor n=1 Tax=Bemisia tabaci TaxID=7038 RepID=A0A9P0CE85_BEMTA|nr:unnamed protein product [Bemisia tabaci]
MEYFTGASGENYFDFSWRNMNGAPLVSYILDSNANVLEIRTGYALWSNIIFYVLGDFAKHRSAVDVVISVPDFDIMPDTGLALWSDASLILTEMNARLRWDDVKFRPTVATDHGSVCIFVPRRGFKPPYLAVLKSFSPTVWVCILVTIAVSLTVHHYHTSLQLRQPRLYTEAELTQYENLSSFLTIYRYFLGVAQPRLLLGRPTSGKILFCVFIFSALILTTLLQSRMVTLTSHQPRFADVDTMEDLKDSGHLVQTAQRSQDFRFLTADATFNWLLERLSDSFYFSSEVLSSEWIYNINYTLGYSHPLNNKTVELIRLSKSSAVKNIRAAMKSDAFASIRPSQMEGRRWFFPVDMEEYCEYHCIEECLITYPHLYLAPSHTFAFAEFNAFLNKYFEAGILVNFKRNFLRDFDADLPSISIEDSAYWRPSSIKDIQIALICFIGGLLLSSVVFLCEIALKF